MSQQNSACHSDLGRAVWFEMPVLSNNAIVLSFGWNTTGMGLKHGFQIEETIMVAHGGAHNDTICMAERRIQGSLFGGEDK